MEILVEQWSTPLTKIARRCCLCAAALHFAQNILAMHFPVTAARVLLCGAAGKSASRIVRSRHNVDWHCGDDVTTRFPKSMGYAMLSLRHNIHVMNFVVQRHVLCLCDAAASSRRSIHRVIKILYLSMVQSSQNHSPLWEEIMRRLSLLHTLKKIYAMKKNGMHLLLCDIKLW